MMLRATKNRIIVRQATEEQRSAGGLILNIQDATDHTRGVVTSVGRDVEHIQEGDTVILSHLGTKITDDLYSIPAEFVIAVESND